MLREVGLRLLVDTVMRRVVEILARRLVVLNVLGVLILVDLLVGTVRVLRRIGACVYTGLPSGPRVHETA